MQYRPLRAAALAVVLVSLKRWVSPTLSPRRHPFVQSVFATVLVLSTRAPLGLRPPALWRGLRVGLLAGAAVAGGAAVGAAIPPVRSVMASQAIPDEPARWLLLRIPLGTVWSEEAVYRAVLGGVAADAFGPVGGRLVQSAAFGLSHIVDARSAGQPVVGTILVTGLAGWVFALLAERTGSLAAPMLAHLAINEAGAVAALAVQRRQ